MTRFALSGANAQTFVLRTSRNFAGGFDPYLPLGDVVLCVALWIDSAGDDARESDFLFLQPVIDLEQLDVAFAMPFALSDSAASIFGVPQSSMQYVAGTFQPGSSDGIAIESPLGWPYATRRAMREDIDDILRVAAGNLALDVAVAADRFVSMLCTQTLHLVQPDGTPSTLEIRALGSAWFLAPGFRVALPADLAGQLGVELQDGVANSLVSYQTYFDGAYSR